MKARRTEGTPGTDTGRVCLDLVATRPVTVTGVARGEPSDLLVTPGGLRRWLAGAGVTSAVPDAPTLETPTLDARALGRVLCLRHAMTLLLDHVLDPPGDPGRLRRAVDTVNGCAAATLPAPRLALTGHGGELAVRAPAPPDVDALLALLARDLLDLLADDDTHRRLRRCAAPDCRRVFLGDRLGRPRRWCPSGGCGARARVAAYRARRAGV